MFAELLLWLCGLASGLYLMVSVFAGVVFCVTGVAHDGWIALGYLVYAAFPSISRQHADMYFNEVGFRWSQRVVIGHVVRRTRGGRQVTSRRGPESCQRYNCRPPSTSG